VPCLNGSGVGGAGGGLVGGWGGSSLDLQLTGGGDEGDTGHAH
jgi:hypothetical protein